MSGSKLALQQFELIEARLSALSAERTAMLVLQLLSMSERQDPDFRLSRELAEQDPRWQLIVETLEELLERKPTESPHGLLVTASAQGTLLLGERTTSRLLCGEECRNRSFCFESLEHPLPLSLTVTGDPDLKQFDLAIRWERSEDDPIQRFDNQEELIEAALIQLADDEILSSFYSLRNGLVPGGVCALSSEVKLRLGDRLPDFETEQADPHLTLRADLLPLVLSLPEWSADSRRFYLGAKLLESSLQRTHVVTVLNDEQLKDALGEIQDKMRRSGANATNELCATSNRIAFLVVDELQVVVTPQTQLEDLRADIAYLRRIQPMVAQGLFRRDKNYPEALRIDEASDAELGKVFASMQVPVGVGDLAGLRQYLLSGTTIPDRTLERLRAECVAAIEWGEKVMCNDDALYRVSRFVKIQLAGTSERAAITLLGEPCRSESFSSEEPDEDAGGADEDLSRDIPVDESGDRAKEPWEEPEDAQAAAASTPELEMPEFEFLYPQSVAIQIDWKSEPSKPDCQYRWKQVDAVVARLDLRNVPEDLSTLPPDDYLPLVRLVSERCAIALASRMKGIADLSL